MTSLFRIFKIFDPDLRSQGHLVLLQRKVQKAGWIRFMMTRRTHLLLPLFLFHSVRSFTPQSAAATTKFCTLSLPDASLFHHHHNFHPPTALHMASTTQVSVSSITSLLSKSLNTATAVAVFFWREFHGMTKAQKLVLFTASLLSFALGRAKPFWKRYETVLDIPKNYFGPKAPVLSGRAVSVSDGDTIRFLHTPTPWSPKGIRKNKKEKASEQALPIRICTIDTPETPKFGKPGQPFGKEAKEELTSLLENKTIRVRLLQADQYGRGVGQVMVGPVLFGTKHVDEHMLKAGLAEVYTGGGAVYGPLGVDAYMELQEQARKDKAGIWSQGKRESAAEYKRRTK